MDQSLWQYPHQSTAWITQLRAGSWPVGAAAVAATTTAKAVATTTAKAAATTTTAKAAATTTAASCALSLSQYFGLQLIPSLSCRSGSGKCAGVAAWSSSATYVGGNEAVYQNQLWKANWWTSGEYVVI